MKASSRNAMRLIKRWVNRSYETGFDVGRGGDLRPSLKDFDWRKAEAEIRDLLREMERSNGSR